MPWVPVVRLSRVACRCLAVFRVAGSGPLGSGGCGDIIPEDAWKKRLWCEAAVAEQGLREPVALCGLLSSFPISVPVPVLTEAPAFTFAPCPLPSFLAVNCRKSFWEPGEAGVCAYVLCAHARERSAAVQGLPPCTASSFRPGHVSPLQFRL